MKSQRQLIKEYNDNFRPKFNKQLFVRHDDDLINALKKIVYSCERHSTFTIEVRNFEVIDNYDDVNHILWEYEDSIINKGRSPRSNKDASKKASMNKKKVNIYDFINLNDSAIKLIKIEYFIEISEKKDGLVNDIITVYIAIPRIVDGFYYKLNGNVYSAQYQIVDASTYNNSASRNAKRQSITFKTVFTPIRVYRYSINMKDIDGNNVPCSYFVVNIFKKSVLLMKYMLAKFGFYDCIKFLKIDGINIVKDIKNINREDNYIFPVNGFYIVTYKALYDGIQIIQSFVYTLWTIMNYMKDAQYEDFIMGNTVYLKSLGADFTTKNMDTIYDKGLSLLDSLEFNYDLMTKEDLKLTEEDKGDIYRVLRWMMYEYNALRMKDNLDISTKKVRYAGYEASLYATKLAFGIYRISDKGDKATLNDIRKAIQIPPMYLINALVKCPLVNYKNCVNDLDSIIALKYTYKGIAGIGEKSNAISDAYRSVHPSHLSRVDIDSSSNSDPGVSGTICPYAELHDWHFDAYEEPSTWESDISKIIDTYRSMQSKIEMCRILSDHNIAHTSNKAAKVMSESLDICKSLLTIPVDTMMNDEYINGFDVFGDGLMFWLNDEQ